MFILQLCSVRFTLMSEPERVRAVGIAFPGLSALHMDCVWLSSLFRNSVIPDMFLHTRFLKVLTLSTPCTMQIATSLTSNCNLLETLSVTLSDNSATLICEIITVGLKKLQSLQVILILDARLSCALESDSLENFNYCFRPGPGLLRFGQIPQMTFPHLKALVYRSCYLKEEHLQHVAHVCPKLLLLDFRHCVMQSGLQDSSTLKHFRDKWSTLTILHD